MNTGGMSWPTTKRKTKYHIVEKFDGREWFTIYRIDTSAGLNKTLDVFRNLVINNGGSLRLTISGS